jgi:hypothetical protein
MAGKVEELYIKVVARAGEAKKELENLRKAGEKAQKPLQDEVNKLKTRVQLRDAYLNKTKEEQKQVRELLKLEGRRVLNEKEAEKAQEKIAKLTDQIVANNKKLESSKQYKTIKDQTDQLDKQAKHIEILNERRKAGLQDYIEFTKRASSENARFADRLDRRDRTRSMSENLRRGMEKGTAISQRWHAEENAVYRLERSLGIASTAFDRVRHPAEAMTDSFYRLQRVGYTVQTALGVLGGTIGDMGGGMLALVGVAGAAAGSLAAVAGAMANLGAGMMVAKFALSGVGAAVQQLWSGQNDYNKSLRDAKKAFRDLRFEAEDAALSEQEAAIALEKARENLARVQDLPADSRARREAELEYQRADLNYRRAKARVNDANKALKKGPAGNPSQNPFNNLTKSQIVFAKYLATLKPVVQSLKEAAASSFLPPLQKSIQVLVTNLVPALKDGLNSVGEALGDASRNFTDAFKDKENIKLFREFLENSKPTIRILGAVANKAFGGILVFLKAAQPITDRFATWVFTVADGFEKWSKSGGEDKLKKFFKLAGDVAASLGDAFKLVFGGLSNIVKATFPNGATSGAGGVILDFLKEIGAGFKLFTGSNEFSGWLKAATENAKITLEALGQVLGIFLDMAGSPANKEFWTTIQSAVPFVKKILEDGQKAGPAFANLIVAVTELISKFSETTAIQIFFTTLQLSANVLSNFVTAIKPLIDFLGIAHGVFLALVVVGALFRRGIQVMMGIMMKLLRVVGSVTTTFENFRGKLAAARADGAVGFKGILDSLRQMKIEMTNLKRIEFLKDVAKGERAKQISAIRDKMGQLNLRTKQGREEAKKYQNEIEAINRSYKKLRAELELNGKAAKNWGQLVGSSAESAKFKLDKFAATQDKMAKWGRIGGRVGAGALALGTTVSSLQSGTGGIGAGISAVGAGLSFLPGVGLAAGIGTSIIGSIVSGFEQANAEKEAAEAQRKMEINAKLVELQAEKVNDVSTITGTLIGVGKDPTAAAASANKIVEAAQKALDNVILSAEDTGFTAESSAASLVKSETLKNFVTDSDTRAAILRAASIAAQSGIFDVRDDKGKVTIDPDSITAFLEQTIGDKTGQAAIDAVNAYSNKNKNKALDYNSYTGKTEVIDPKMRTAKIKAGPFISALSEFYATKQKPTGSKLKPGQTVFDKYLEKYNPTTTTPKGPLGPPSPVTNPELFPKSATGSKLAPALSSLFGKSNNTPIFVKDVGKKSTKENVVPKSTSNFYDKSLIKNQSMIDILTEIRDNTKPSTTSTTYGPFMTGVIP